MKLFAKRELEASTVGLRIRVKGNLGAEKKAAAIAEILLSIKNRSATRALSLRLDLPLPVDIYRGLVTLRFE
jgi:hypothetical protein